MSHYIVDVAVFGHVMDDSTPWGTENNHSKYEDYVTPMDQPIPFNLLIPYLSLWRQLNQYLSV